MRAYIRRCRSKKGWLIDRAWKGGRYMDQSAAVGEGFGDCDSVSRTVQGR